MLDSSTPNDSLRTERGALASQRLLASELVHALVLAHTGRTDTESERLSQAAHRLKASVIRPLSEALTSVSPSVHADSANGTPSETS